MSDEVIDLSVYRKHKEQQEVDRMVTTRPVWVVKVRSYLIKAAGFCLVLQFIGCNWLDTLAWLGFASVLYGAWEILKDLV